MANPLGEAEYPIAAVSKLTGVSCHALRVWERRYGFPVPQRSASGHRRYSLEQVLILRRLSELSQAGRSISELIAEARAGRLTVGPAALEPVDVDNGLGCQFTELLDRMASGDVLGASACFDRLEAALTPDELLIRVIAPALTEAGERPVPRPVCDLPGALRQRVPPPKLDTAIESAPA